MVLNVYPRAICWLNYLDCGYYYYIYFYHPNAFSYTRLGKNSDTEEEAWKNAWYKIEKDTLEKFES